MAKKARQTAARPGNKPKSAVRRGFKGLFSRLFCKRSVIIISDHKTSHVPFTATTQFVTCVIVLGLVMFGSYSSGSYVAAQKVIDEKQQKLETFAEENARVEAEFGLLKQDLQKLADGGKGNKTADAAKDLAAQYNTADASAPIVGNPDVDAKYNAVFTRIQFLENKVRDLQANHDAMMADIRATTGGKIKELEKVIARTGMDSEPLQRAAEAKRNQDEQQREKYGRTVSGSAAPVPAPAISNGQGGPFIPASAAPVAPGQLPAEKPVVSGGQGGPFIPASTGSVLQEKDTELYFNLRKLMVLNDVVGAMPLDIPLAEGVDYHRTSGFGTRVDPFRGTLSFHAGVDLAGPSGSQVLATNDGRVEFAGWMTAYGNAVDIKHEYGFGTRYGHMSKILVRPGQFVKKGQVIGIQGSTGRSTGEHVHYEVRYNDQPINPANFLKVGEDVRALN
jgi:murein DD-endopeptidase MepM/ murein hydrolase activator NlpD